MKNLERAVITTTTAQVHRSDKQNQQPNTTTLAETIDTGLAHCDQHRLHYSPSTDHWFCFVCNPEGAPLSCLPDEQQQQIRQVLHA